MPKIAVIGSRSISSYDDYETVRAKLDFLLVKLKDIEIVSGGAKGLDKLAEKYAEERAFKIKVFLPDYETYSLKVAPLKRNHQIVDYADMLVAFTTGSNGTAYTIKMAKRKGMPIRIIKM